MIKKFSNWYQNLTPLKKLSVSFVLNWVYWLIAWMIADHFLFNENHPWKYHVFHATWMASFFTIFYNWKNLKQIIKGQAESTKA